MSTLGVGMVRLCSTENLWMSAMSIRKQVYHLTPDDLDRFPVWEYALDEEGVEGQDEATVRPYEVLAALDPAEGMFIVKAAFTLADGSQELGYLTPPVQGDSSLGTLQPAIVTVAGQVSFWCGVITPSAEFLAESYRLLQRDASQVFPFRFKSVVDLVGGQICGEVPGFLILEDWKTGRTRVIA